MYLNKTTKILGISLFYSLLSPILAYSEEELSVRLSDTVITTQGFASTTQQEQKNIAVVNNNDIENQGYSNVSDIFIYSPYLNVRSGEKTSDVVIDMRGQGKDSSSRVKVMLDSISLNVLDTSHSNSPLNLVPVGQIDQIEIVPGGGSVLYGNGATGGVVNIITKSDLQKEYGYIDWVRKFGGYYLNDYGFGIGKQITQDNKAYISLDYGQLDSEGYRDLEERGGNDIAFSFAYNISDNQKISISQKVVEVDGISSDGISAEEIKEDRFQAGGFVSEYNEQLNSTSIKYEALLLENISVSMNLYRQLLESSTSGSGDVRYNGHIVDGTMEGDFKETKLGFNLKEKIEYSSGSFILGYSYLKNSLLRDSDVDMEFVTGPGMPPMTYTFVANNDLKKTENSAFVVLNHSIKNKFNISTGYRYEHAQFDINRTNQVLGAHPSLDTIDTNKTENNNAYQASFSYDINPVNKFYINYERGYVSPSPTQLINKDETGYVVNDIKSQTGNNYEVGYKGYLFHSYYSITYFLSQNNDEISRRGDEHSSWEYLNLEDTVRTGLEIFSETSWYDYFLLRKSFTYIHSEIKKGDFASQDIALVPQFDIKLQLDYNILHNFSISSRVNYVGKYLKQNILPSEIEDNELSYAPSVLTLDLLTTYLIGDNISMFFGINNILNEEYNISQDSYGNYIVAPGRNYYFGLRYSI